MKSNSGNIFAWAWALIAIYLVVWIDSLTGMLGSRVRDIVIQAGAIFCLAFGGNLLLKRLSSR
ncbi:MAG: hypothetical protein K2L31_01790 [Muribaculum sp.]|nr:hypothetical protein [Muribaculum sp.]MDE6457313.1 hypothetical protein [Muribaculum sp.]